MNRDFRKVALIAASLGLLLSLFLALRPDDEEGARATTVATTTAPTTTTAETEPPATTTEPPATTAPKPPDVVTIRIAVPSDTAPTVRRYSVRKGRKVVLVVRTELSDHVHLHGYDLIADVGPGMPATIRFTATAPGRFEIELEDRGLHFAELEVHPLTLLAHGLGGVRDLPVPGWLFLWGAAVVLVLSFVALGALWKRPELEPRGEGRPLPPALDRGLRSTIVRVLAGGISAGLLVLVFLTALLGEPSSATNFAPTFVLIVFWLGLVPVQVLFGNVWRVLNPWLAIADAVAWVWARLGQTWTPPLGYPARLGVWPAAFFLFCFAALELAYAEPADPRALALAIALYSYAMWFGMAAYGRRTWDDHGNGFTVYFGLLARIGPFGERNGRLVVRTPLSGLAGADPTPGLLAFVAVMLGSVGFDGLSRAVFWQNLRADLEAPYVLEAPGTAELLATALALGGLIAAVLVVAGAYLAATKVAERTIGAGRSLVPDFILSLVPVALVYAVAHYFSYFFTSGQYIVPLASDPFGYGWDLFGTLDYTPTITPFSPNTIWYVQVATLVAGHVAGLAVAHDRAVAIASERDALRSQYAMLALMVVYTLAGMWLLSLD